MGSLGYGIVQTAEAVNQLDVLGIRSEPNSSLCYLLHIVHVHLSAVCHTLAEEGIATVHVGLHVGYLVGTPRTGASGSGVGTVAVGLHFVILEAQLLGHQFAEVWQGTEDADAARQGSRLCHDVAGSHAHIVST